MEPRPTVRKNRVTLSVLALAALAVLAAAFGAGVPALCLLGAVFVLMVRFDDVPRA